MHKALLQLNVLSGFAAAASRSADMNNAINKHTAAACIIARIDVYRRYYYDGRRAGQMTDDRNIHHDASCRSFRPVLLKGMRTGWTLIYLDLLRHSQECMQMYA